MKNCVIDLVSKNGTIASYKDKEEAYKMLGYEFIFNNVGFELRTISRHDRLYSYLIDEGDKFIRRQWMIDGKTRYGDVMDKIANRANMNRYGQYMLVTEYNERLCIADFYEIIMRERKKREDYNHYKYRYNWKYWNGEGAVPGTGSKGYRHRKYYRYPQTMNARRAASEVSFHIENDEDENDVYEIFVPVRNSRSMWKLPNSWDDLPRASNEIKNWKKFRDKQYKEKPQK